MCRTVCFVRDLWAWYPPVGVFIGILAVVSVALPFYKEVKDMGKIERASWTILMFVLVGLEFKSIYQERAAHEKEQNVARAEQLRQFKITADGIDTSLSKMESITELSSSSLKLSSKALQQITGGGQYCYLSAAYPSVGGKVGFFVMNSGPLPLERCFVVIHENIPIKSAQDAERAFQPIVVKELGPIAPGKNQGIGTDIVLPAKSYYIQIFTRNDRFYETLTVHPEFPNGKKGEGSESIEIRDSKWKMVYSSP